MRTSEEIILPLSDLTFWLKLCWYVKQNVWSVLISNVLSQFVHKFIVKGQNQPYEYLSSHIFTVAKRGVQVKKN